MIALVLVRAHSVTFAEKTFKTGIGPETKATGDTARSVT